MQDLQFFNVDGTLRKKTKKITKNKPSHELEDK